MKSASIVFLVAIGFTACNAQNNKHEAQSYSTSDSAQDQPHVSWNVTKKYDNNGNVIGYDSTYVWTYSSKNGTTENVYVDSVMNQFRQQFDAEFPALFSKNFGTPIWNDSLFYRDFTKPDYFIRRWRENSFDMEGMMRGMDSVRNQFFKEKYPGLLPYQRT